MNVYCAPLGTQNGSTAVYSLLKHAFTLEYGNIGLPEIKKTPNGKPYFHDRRDIHFSLSHSRTHVLCALSRSPVGADIESPRQINERVVNFFCSPAELVLFEPLDIWVLKESYIKLIGGTLAMIKKLRFSREIEIILAPDEDVKSRLYRVNGCHIGVCSINEAPPDRVIFISLSTNTHV